MSQSSAVTQLGSVLRLFPDAVLSGASVLSFAGWTTQYCHLIEINIPSQGPCQHLKGVNTHQRPLEWFKRLHASGQLLMPDQVEFHTAGLRTLTPALALADCYADVSHWQPDPDDLEIDLAQVSASIRAWQEIYPDSAVPEKLQGLLRYFDVNVDDPRRRGDRRFMDGPTF